MTEKNHSRQLENMYNFILDIAMRKRISTYESKPHLKDFEDALSKQRSEENEKQELKPEHEKKEMQSGRPKKEKRVYGTYK